METVWATLQEAFTDQTSGKNLSIIAMSIRAVFIFIVWLVTVRVADRRMLGRYSAFDVVLSVMIGAVLGRPINGGAPLWGTLAAVAALVAVHWGLAFVAHRWQFFGRIIKGDSYILVSEGRICSDEMRKNLLTENDLKEMLRLRARLADPAEARQCQCRKGQGERVSVRRDTGAEQQQRGEQQVPTPHPAESRRGQDLNDGRRIERLARFASHQSRDTGDDR